jgi:ABC-type transport system involved in multi-copper enzyme maturation permease subunit
MKHIFIRELQELFKDNRLWIFFIVILLITVCSGIVSSLNYKSVNSQNQFLIQSYEADMESESNSLQGVVFTDHLALRPIDSNTFLTGDITSNYPNHIYVELPVAFFGSRSIHLPQKTVSSKISSLPFIRYDLLFIVEVLFSFMMIILVYNSISKEKEDNTLSLILSNSISRTAVLTGKILAYSSVALFSLLLAALVQLLVVIFMRIIPIDASIFPQLISFLILSFLYLFFWIILSVCISTSAKKSAISLTYLIIIWIAVVFIIPSSGRIFLERSDKSLPSSQEVKMNYEQIENDMWEEAGKNNGGWRGGNLRANEKDDHILEKNLAPVYLRWMDIFYNYQHDVTTKYINQLDFLYNYSAISPSFLYHRIIESTNNRGQHEFLENVRLFRENLMQTIIEQDKNDEDSFHLYFLPNYMSKKPVKRDLIPTFTEPDRTYSDIIHQNILYIILFLGEILVLFIFCQFIFSKSDVR